MGAIESVLDSSLLELLSCGKSGAAYDLPVTSKEKSEGSSRTIEYGVASMQGWRLRNEDAHICIPQLREGDPNSPALFGIMDGHGGKGVARVAADKLPDILRKSPFFLRGDYQVALRSAFLEMDAFLSTPEGRREVKRLDLDEPEDEMVIQSDEDSLELSGPDLQGCTCCIALIVPGTGSELPKVFCANAGDSRCIFGTSEICVGLCEDHKPNLPEEEKRVIAAGGCVLRDILGGPRINGGLNVSRGFGDFQYKRRKGLRPQEQMVSPMPDVMQHKWGVQNDMPNAFLILACDGIWDRNTNEDAVKFVSERLEKKKLSTICGDLCDATLATPADRQSMTLARYTGQDNMTVVIVRPHEALWGAR